MRKYLIAGIIFAALCVPAMPQNNAQPSQARSSSPVPAAITSIGESAEDLYDAAKTEHWDEATKKLAELQAARQQLPKVAGDVALEDQIQNSITQLGITVVVKDQLRTMQQANIITRDAAELSDHYQRTLPLQVALLDFYGRQLETASLTDNTMQLTQTAKNLAQTWQALRPVILQKGGSTQAADWDKLVQQIQSANKASEYKKLAKVVDDQVDQLEQFLAPSTATKR
jgi:glyoxylate carboligase